MNIQKRLLTLKSIRDRAAAYARKATRIAGELETSFRGQSNPRAKTAQRGARQARALARTLVRATEV